MGLSLGFHGSMIMSTGRAWQGAGSMPAVLNSEILWGFEPASTLPVLLSGGTVHLPYIWCVLDTRSAPL